MKNMYETSQLSMKLFPADSDAQSPSPIYKAEGKWFRSRFNSKKDVQSESLKKDCKS